MNKIILNVPRGDQLSTNKQILIFAVRLWYKVSELCACGGGGWGGYGPRIRNTPPPLSPKIFGIAGLGAT